MNAQKEQMQGVIPNVVIRRRGPKPFSDRTLAEKIAYKAHLIAKHNSAEDKQIYLALKEAAQRRVAREKQMDRLRNFLREKRQPNSETTVTEERVEAWVAVLKQHDASY